MGYIYLDVNFKKSHLAMLQHDLCHAGWNKERCKDLQNLHNFFIIMAHKWCIERDGGEWDKVMKIGRQVGREGGRRREKKKERIEIHLWKRECKDIFASGIGELTAGRNKVGHRNKRNKEKS